jgi:hypothetical protein
MNESKRRRQKLEEIYPKFAHATFGSVWNRIVKISVLGVKDL